MSLQCDRCLQKASPLVREGKECLCRPCRKLPPLDAEDIKFKRMEARGLL